MSIPFARLTGYGSVQSVEELNGVWYTDLGTVAIIDGKVHDQNGEWATLTFENDALELRRGETYWRTWCMDGEKICWEGEGGTWTRPPPGKQPPPTAASTARFGAAREPIQCGGGGDRTGRYQENLVGSPSSRSPCAAAPRYPPHGHVGTSSGAAHSFSQTTGLAAPNGLLKSWLLRVVPPEEYTSSGDILESRASSFSPSGQLEAGVENSLEAKVDRLVGVVASLQDKLQQWSNGRHDKALALAVARLARRPRGPEIVWEQQVSNQASFGSDPRLFANERRHVLREQMGIRHPPTLCRPSMSDG